MSELHLRMRRLSRECQPPFGQQARAEYRPLRCNEEPLLVDGRRAFGQPGSVGPSAIFSPLSKSPSD